jgi:ribosomal-protein-alanine N-acetyltransferase
MVGKTTIKPNEIEIRFMQVGDLEQVIEVDQASFTTPWSPDAFYHELLYNRLAFYLVAVIEGRVVGYCGTWIIVDEAHVTNIAVHPDFRGRKIGEQLLRSLKHLARFKGATKITLEVRVSNHVAQNLYHKLGFRIEGRRPGYYTDNQEDALIMWANLYDEEGNHNSLNQGEHNE